jgi:hypothetical protein
MNVKQAAPAKKRSTQVPGQLYGYLLQVTRLVAHLLRAGPGQSVSVEHLDDVATDGPHGVIAEQDKSGLAHNPVADRSFELWKTLHNWVRAIREGALKSDTKFILYVAQDHHGSVIDRIHAVTNKADADALVQALRNEFWGKAPKHAKRGKLPPGLAEHVNGVLSASDNVVSLLFVNLTLENGSGAPNDDLFTAIAEKPISESAREDVLKHLLGWADRTIKKLIEKKQAAILPWEDFQKQLIGAAKKFDRADNVLAASAVDISEAEVQKELRARTYVRQLQAVNCKDSELLQGVNDFLRSAVHRTTWSGEGDVLEGSFQEFEEDLGRAWHSQKAVVEIEQKSLADEDRGRLLYNKCVQLRVSLQGMEVPAFFVPGSFHTLADTLRVGWHPQYRDLFSRSGSPKPSGNEQDETALESAPAAPATGRGIDDEGGGE